MLKETVLVRPACGVVVCGVVVVLIVWLYSTVLAAPVLLGLVVLNLLHVMRWRDLAAVPWEIVALYAGASALGKGLAVTGAGLYIGDSFVHLLPESWITGTGLSIAASGISALVTNVMTDGAAVSAIGPVVLPLAAAGGAQPWMVGLATSFASSFAYLTMVGSPGNAIVFALARDPVEGRPLLSLVDFLKHGAAALLISLLVLWTWALLGYWRWLGPG
ncbi:MAG TPA: hypothetical protein ENI92_05165 [Bacteroidetes bacterium]|nr:hypothetical protein [Bacteroidota bacterium]